MSRREWTGGAPRPSFVQVARRVALSRVVLVVAVLVTVLVTVVALGCSSRPAPVTASVSNDWVAALLGHRSSMSIVLRPAALLNDPYWGPPMQRALAKPSRKEDPDEVPNEQVGPMFGATQIELFVSVRDHARLSSAPKEQIGSETLGYVFVVRGMAMLDPLRMTTRRGERVFAPPIRLGSGVLEFPPAPAYAQRHRGLATWLYVMPDGTWVGVDHGSAPRARAVYASHRFAPPTMTFAGNGLLGLFVDAAMIDAAARRSDSWRDTEVWTRGLTGMGLVLYGGRDGAVEAILDYRLDGDASRTEDLVKTELLATCTKNELACAIVKLFVRDVKVTRDDTRVSARFFFTDLMLRKLAQVD